MGKAKANRRYEDNQAGATLKSLRVSPSKLNLVAGLIRGSKVDNAVQQLQFSNKAVAKDVLKLLQSAIANAENNHNLDIDRLYVREVNVGRSIVMKRFQARARGRAYRIQKPFSNISITLEERED
jgi:large subunit ribosomal protein L22